MESTLNLFELSQDYDRIEQAIRYLQANYRRQPELDETSSVSSAAGQASAPSAFCSS